MKKFFSLLAFISISISYSSAQAFQEWVQRFNGSDSLNDRAFAIDVHGCIYVSGSSTNNSTADFTTLKYNNRGQLLWSRTITGIAPGGGIARDIVIDNFCNVYVTGNNGGIFTTVKYDSSGVEKWVATYSALGPTASNAARFIGIDNSGNVYVTGTSVESATSIIDFTTIKYDNNGAQQWITHFNGAANLFDVVSGNFVDADGNVYVNGRSQKADGTYDLVTIKYDSSGTALWTSTIADSMASGVLGTAAARGARTDPITVDNSGNVYITGTAGIGIGNNFDILTAKYNPAGVLQWKVRIDGTANGFDKGNDIATDKAGNVYITGLTTNTGSFTDYTTMKISSNGIIRWMQKFDGPANGSDDAAAIALDENNNVYVTGTSLGISSGTDYTTIKYSSVGKLEWTQRYNGPANGFDNAIGIALDKDVNVYVTGGSQGVNTSTDFATIKYNQKLGQAIQPVMEDVKTVALGLLEVSQSPAIRNLVYRNIRTAEIDSAHQYFFISVSDLIDSAAAVGINLKDSMNRTINKINGTNPTKDNLTRILNGMVFKGTRLKPHIFIPHLDEFDSTALADSNPLIGYGFLENDYPLNGYSGINGNIPEEHTIIRSDVHVTPTWLSYATLPWPPIMNTGPVPVILAECLLDNVNCSTVCHTTIGGIVAGTTPSCIGGAGGANELVILLPTPNDGCIDATPFVSIPSQPDYALLSSFSNFDYWFNKGTNAESGLMLAQKVLFPIKVYNYLGFSGNEQDGNVLTLCKQCNKFDNMSDMNGVYGALGQHGIFKLSRLNQLPLYFILPLNATGLWNPLTSPDSDIYFGTTTSVTNPSCTGGENIQEDYLYRSSSNYLSNSFGLGTDVLASTDFNAINNFWNSNTIVVAFGRANTTDYKNVPDEMLAFTAPSTTAPLTPGTLIQKLEIQNTNEYMIRRSLILPLIGFPQGIPKNSSLIIHVVAKFNTPSGNKLIDYWQPLILGSTSTQNFFNRVAVDIRGQIDDSVSSYLIEIFNP